jgi:hypothetical protein
MHEKITAIQLASSEERASGLYQLRHSDDASYANASAKKVEEQANNLIDEAMSHLSTRLYLTLGLIFYFISAVLEFAAGVDALNGR